jgi:hypothetical protein
VLRDLIDRRLWPVALLLAVGAVAVPVYLGRSSSTADETPVPATTAQAKAPMSKAAVSLADDATADDATSGSVRNPFKQQHVPKVDTTTSSATTSQSGGATSTTGADTSPSGGSGSTDDGATGNGSTGTGQTGDQGTSTKVSGYHVTLHLGTLGGLETYKDVARLSPLPSASDPLFVFTGLLKGGKKIVLLPSYGVTLTPESDVQCKPSNATCETIEMAEGDTIFFKLLGDDTGALHQLDVVSISGKGASKSASVSAASLQRHSNAGAAMLRDAHVNAGDDYQGTSDYRWLPDAGVLVRTPQHSKARASANGAAAASAADVTAALPGLPVWHWQSGS